LISSCSYYHLSLAIFLGERILKIGPHLPKLLTNIKGFTFLRHNQQDESSDGRTNVLQQNMVRIKIFYLPRDNCRHVYETKADTLITITNFGYT